MKKSYRALNFSLTPRLLRGKNTNYTGPKTAEEIISVVLAEAKDHGYKVTDVQARAVVRAFFYRIISHMHKGDMIIVDDLGRFGPSKKQVKFFEKRDTDRYYNNIRIIRKSVKKQKRKKKYLTETQPLIIDEIRKQWEEFNRMREERGLSPWKFAEWRYIFKIPIPTGIRPNFNPKSVKKVDKRNPFYRKRRIKN